MYNISINKNTIEHCPCITIKKKHPEFGLYIFNDNLTLTHIYEDVKRIFAYVVERFIDLSL